MKHATFNLTRRIILLILILSLALTGCAPTGEQPATPDDPPVTQPENPNPERPTPDKENPDETESDGFAIGFWYDDFGIMGIYPLIAVKSDKSTFDINDVTLEYSYGTNYYHTLESYIATYKICWGNARLYFTNCDGDIAYIKTTDEPLTSEKYQVTSREAKIEDDPEDSFGIKYEYKYSEMLTIPKELFTKDSGYVWIRIVAENTVDEQPEMEDLIRLPVQYEKVDENNVKISVKYGWTSEELKNFPDLPDVSTWPTE